MSLLGRSSRRESGQSLVEFAIVLPILALVLLGLVDTGRIIFTYVALAEAVQEGALYASQVPFPESGIRSRVQTSSSAVEVTGATVSAPCSSASVTITAYYDLPLITPIGAQIFGGAGFRVQATNTSTNFKGACS